MHNSESIQIEIERSPMVSLRDRIKGLVGADFKLAGRRINGKLKK